MTFAIGTTTLPAIVLAAGGLSAALYARKRRWTDVLLVAVAAAALSVALADVRLSAVGAAPLAIATDAQGTASEADLLAVPQASAIALTGDGLWEAQWRDLPARPLQWQPAAADLLWLDFPRTVALGRAFTLSVRRAQPQAGWRLQLLAENKQLLAEAVAADAKTAQLSVQWLPPLAEAMVLQARLLDAAGKTIAQGPVPLVVKEALPLQIQGRFDAASFDARALNQLLVDGNAILDWQVMLGKAVGRGETARAALSAPNAMVVDAAYMEHQPPAARAALLAPVAQGLPLLVLGGNAADAAMWQRELGLRLLAQSATTEKEDQRQFNVNGVAMALPPAGLNPPETGGGSWSVLAQDVKRRPWLWQRDWQQGRIVWIGVADWHRYAISAPQALGLWWQGALDQMALASVQKAAWRQSGPMPLAGLRSEVCAQGVNAGAVATVDGKVELVLQNRADKADAACAAIWPPKSGWMHVSSAQLAEPGLEYVYAAADWPMWQRALRRDATAQYAARTPDTGVAGSEPKLPSAPFALAFALCMLGLWWREQR